MRYSRVSPPILFQLYGEEAGGYGLSYECVASKKYEVLRATFKTEVLNHSARVRGGVAATIGN